MKKIFKKRSTKQPETPLRITNETVSEHRERILAGGRRFKYPIQYARHRLVINAIIVSVATLILLVAVSWWQLYQVQNTSTFFYRVTRVLPLPVASVDGEAVRYGDYLMRYRALEHYERTQPSQIQIDSKDGKRLLDSYKRGVMDQVVADAYAAKLAGEHNITVTEDEINQIASRDLETSNGRISQELYDASAYDNYGYTPDEYRLIIQQSIIRQKVAYAIDEKSLEQKNQVQQLVTVENADLAAVAKQVGGTGDQQVVIGASGLVPKNNIDGGLTATAMKLEKGQISPAIKSTTGDGYYFVRLIDVTGTQLSYEYIKVPLTAFKDKVAALKKDGKVKEHISIPASTTQTIKQ